MTGEHANALASRTVQEHDEDIDVLLWRRDYFCALGFDETDAALLAHNPQIDTHETERLIRGGCPPTLALEILV